MLGCSVIASKRVWPTGQELSDLPGDHFIVFLVYESDLVVRADGPPHSLHPHVLGIVQPDEHKHPLGHAKVLLHGDARDKLLGAAADLRLEPLTSTLDDLQRREVELLDRQVVDPADQERRNHMDVGHPVALDQGKNVGRACRGRQNDLASAQQETLQAGAGQRQVVGQRKYI